MINLHQLCGFCNGTFTDFTLRLNHGKIRTIGVNFKCEPILKVDHVYSNETILSLGTSASVGLGPHGCFLRRNQRNPCLILHQKQRCGPSLADVLVPSDSIGWGLIVLVSSKGWDT